MAGKFRKWVKKTFKTKKMALVPADAPTAEQLYSGPAAFSGYQPEAARAQGDQAGVDAARTSLGQLQGLAQTGWTDTGRGQYEAMLRRGQQASAGVRQAALQGAAARGTASGGAGLLAGLAGGQQDANAAADAAVGFAAQGEQNRMGASQAAGSLGMGLDAQQFGQQFERGSATDQFNQFATGAGFDAQQTAWGNRMQQYEARAAREAEQHRRRMARLSLGISSGIQAAGSFFGGRSGNSGGGSGGGG